MKLGPVILTFGTSFHAGVVSFLFTLHAFAGDRDLPGALNGIGGCNSTSISAQCLFEAGQNDSNKRADDAREQAKKNAEEARLRSGLASQIRNDTPPLERQLNEIRSSNAPEHEKLRRIETVLSRKWEVPADYSPLAKAHGLSTLGNLYHDGPSALERLESDRDKYQSKADQLLQSANRAATAARQMGNLDLKSQGNLQRLRSIDNSPGAIRSSQNSPADISNSLAGSREGDNSLRHSGTSTISAPENPKHGRSSLGIGKDSDGSGEPELNKDEKALLSGASDPSRKIASTSKQESNQDGNSKIGEFLRDLDKHLAGDELSSGSRTHPSKDTLELESGSKPSGISETPFPTDPKPLIPRDINPLSREEFAAYVSGSNLAIDAPELFQRVHSQYKRRENLLNR